MSDVLKKPYEISLWEEQLYWHRRKLVLIGAVKEKDYKPGKYYSLDTNAIGANPYVLDNGTWVENKNYYSLAPKEEVIENKTVKNYKEGPSSTRVDLTQEEAADESWKISTVFQFYKEHKLCIIGSNTMTTPIRAVNCKFNSKITGENILTFTVYSHYWDEENNCLQWNPFMLYLTNERKVKLKYEDEWYDFVIKNISEDSNSKAFTYTCKDLFLNELSKTGFEIEFDNKLGNNMDTLPNLGKKVLEGSDWELAEENVVVRQFLEEPLYEFTLQSSDYLPPGLKMKKMDGVEAEENLPYGKKIYVFYSSVNKQSTTLQFLYDPSGLYALNDKNIIIGHSLDTPSGIYNYYISNIFWEESEENGSKLTPKIKITNEDEENTYDLTTTYAVFAKDRRGEKLVKSPKTSFDPKLQRVVTHYNSGNIHGFTTTEYISPAAVRNYVTNSDTFSDTVGWIVGKTDATDNGNYPTLEPIASPSIQQYIDAHKNDEGGLKWENYNPTYYLSFDPVVASQVLINTGLNSNKTYIKEFVKGDVYYLRLKVSDYSFNNNYFGSVSVCEYEFSDEDGIYKPTELFTLVPVTLSKEFNYEYKAICKKSISEIALKNKRLGIFIKGNPVNNIMYALSIEKLQFFKEQYYEDGTGTKYLCTPDTSFDPSIKKQYWYFDPTSEYTSLEDLNPEYRGYKENKDYVLYYGNGNQAYEKVRSITAKESNRFNLIQSLCELFECWARFTINHEANGAIKLDNNYRQEKFVSFHEYIGKDKYVGFKYGINLKSIKRTLDSGSTISKIIVKNNSNEFAPNGFCTIARAPENPTGENFIYNFDYYVGQGLIDFSTLNNDLNFEPNIGGHLGYYKSLKLVNEEIQRIIELQAQLVGDISDYSSSYQTYKLSFDSANEDLTNQYIAFEQLTNISFEKFFENPIEEGSNKEGWLKSEKGVEILAAIATDKKVIDKHKNLYEYYDRLLQKAEDDRKKYEKRLKELVNTKLAINQRFYKKYSRFIQEGSWISEDYMDDNLYYLDALSTLYTSSRPKVTYTIDTVELSALPEYSGYVFKIGDKTFVEDAEFFGRAYDGSNRLYREEVIVTEMIFELDSPEKNIVKVQNYKTQFEDLFQRIVATTQQVQFSTGEYKRGAAIVQPDGTIAVTTLQNSFTNNAITLQNAKDQSVIIGDTGITTTNLAKPSEILRIVSGGIFLSNDGGSTWTTGITANGINANSITTGSLNVERVNLTMGSETAFRWDALGITAYKNDNTGINNGIFTRFDQFGLYGVNGSNGFDALTLAKKENNSLSGEALRNKAMDIIFDTADFGLTWNKFWLRAKDGEYYTSISSEKDFEVVKKGDREIPIIKIGRIGDGNYGLRISNLDNEPVLEAYQDGALWLKKVLQVETSGFTNEVKNSVRIGHIQDGDKHGEAKKILDANGVFRVYDDGHVKGTSAHFSGGSTFEGTITATGGTIGGLDVEEWKDMGYSVIIESSAGLVLKNTGETTLTATLYFGTEPYGGDEYQIDYFWYKKIDGDEWFLVQGIDGEGISSNTCDVSIGNDKSITYKCEVKLTPTGGT